MFSANQATCASASVKFDFAPLFKGLNGAVKALIADGATHSGFKSPGGCHSMFFVQNFQNQML